MNASTISSGAKGQIPAAANLADWSSREWTDGVQINEMDDLETMTVQTQNSVYEITVPSPIRAKSLFVAANSFPNGRRWNFWAPPSAVHF